MFNLLLHPSCAIPHSPGTYLSAHCGNSYWDICNGAKVQVTFHEHLLSFLPARLTLSVKNAEGNLVSPCYRHLSTDVMAIRGFGDGVVEVARASPSSWNLALNRTCPKLVLTLLFSCSTDDHLSPSHMDSMHWDLEMSGLLNGKFQVLAAQRIRVLDTIFTGHVETDLIGQFVAQEFAMFPDVINDVRLSAIVKTAFMKGALQTSPDARARLHVAAKTSPVRPPRASKASGAKCAAFQEPSEACPDESRRIM